MSEINGINELTQGKFPTIFKIIDHYQHKYPFLTDKLKCATYKHIYFRGGRNNNFKLITCKGKCLFR